jgi:hypothetical protein
MQNKYSPHILRIWISNAESSLRWFADKKPENMTAYDEKAVELNLHRIAKFSKMLTSSKGFNYKYL